MPGRLSVLLLYPMMVLCNLYFRSPVGTADWIKDHGNGTSMGTKSSFIEKIQRNHNMTTDAMPTTITSHMTSSKLSDLSKMNIRGLEALQCSSGEYILPQYYCDGSRDCSDGSDETDLCPQHGNKSAPCRFEQYACRDGKCISNDVVCDGFWDCNDGSDEKSCIWPICYSGSISCQTATDVMACYSLSQWNCGEKCLSHAWLSRVCQFRTQIWATHFNDRLNMRTCMVDPPKRVPDHLPCGDECDWEKYGLCGSSECYSVHDLCDGFAACHNGGDEASCDHECAGRLKCRRHAVCVDIGAICDGTFDCPGGDDEKWCVKEQLTCPDGCTCTGLSISCMGTALDLFPGDRMSGVRKWDLSYNDLKVLASLGEIYPFLKHLNVSHNKITRIFDFFANSFNIEMVDLSYNGLTQMEHENFHGLISLRELYLQGNPMTFFTPLVDAQERLLGFHAEVFAWPVFNICCVLKEFNVRGCETARSSKVASCEKNLKYVELRILLWIMGILAVLGNFQHLVREGKRRQEDRIRFLYITNTNFAGMAMGVYLIVLSAIGQGSNLILSNKGAESEVTQKLCMFFTFMLIFSCSASFHALSTLAIQNFVIPHISLSALKKKTFQLVLAVNLLLAWVIPGMLGAIPLLSRKQAYIQKDFYRFCHPYKFLLPEPTAAMRKLKENADSFTAGVFLGINLGSLTVVMACALCHLKEIIKQGMTSKDLDSFLHHLGHRAMFSKTLCAVIVCDCVVWLAVAVLGWLGMSGELTLGNYQYAWVILILIPSTSALNPIILITGTVCRRVGETVTYTNSRRKRVFVISRKRFFSRHAGRTYKKMTHYLAEDGQLTPYEVFHMMKNMYWSIKDLHKEGMVCDSIGCDFVLVCIDGKGRVRYSELVATTEYPKSDIHEWREKRDIYEVARICEKGLAHLQPHCIRPGSFKLKF